MLFLAQLIEPPLQPGPVRIPNRPAQERERQEQAPPGPVLQPESAPPADPATEPTDPIEQPSAWRPSLQGRVPYNSAELNEIFSTWISSQDTICT